ncbi:MAG: hypothetical protein NTY38_16455 [Acidobacteria bacterium]|nr:hypothetical protein [Acidobacteriota bacterium]
MRTWSRRVDFLDVSSLAPIPQGVSGRSFYPLLTGRPYAPPAPTAFLRS